MIGKIQTLFLALTLAAVVWIGVTQQRQQSAVGKYSFVLNDGDWIVFNTATGELSKMTATQDVLSFLEVNFPAHSAQARAVSVFTDPQLVKEIKAKAKKGSD